MNDATVHILLIDDDPDFINDFKILMPATMTCLTAVSADEAYERLQGKDIDVVFLDINLGAGVDGLQFLERLKQEWPYLPVIMITADTNPDTVVKAMQLGASDFVGKSPDLDKLKFAVEQSIQKNRLQLHYDLLESELSSLIGEMVGRSSAMQRIREEITRLAAVSSTVLITGESGTGKELVARAIHRLSPRAKQPFLAVNCAALSGALFESELFGYEKGAFSGADDRHIGKFELAGSGTLFLDEITEISPSLQAKLLRVLQEREFERLGSSRLIPLRARILASTNRDVEDALTQGLLRDDLLYRLRVGHVHLPPLRERRDDIPELVTHFIHMHSQQMKKKIDAIDDEALQQLCTYHWPGNVRNLSNCIENAIVHTANQRLTFSDFGRIMVDHSQPLTYEEAKKNFLVQFKRDYIAVILKKNNGNISETARQMAVSRQGLKKMMAECGLDTTE